MVFQKKNSRFNCEEYQNILGEKIVRIHTTVEAWNRLQETGLWDEVVKILNGAEISK